jgi:predicted dehydrogenase
MGVTDLLRIGLLGAAAIAPNALITPSRKVDSVEVAAVAARDPRGAAAFAAKHGIDQVHASYDALLADPKIDAVYIPLPNGLHGAWTSRALEAGKHVLCEKPFAANATEAASIAAQAATSNLVVMEAFHWRYHPTAQRMVDILRAGELGELTHLEASVCFPLPKRGDIRFSLPLAGGALMDAGCYAINLVRTAAAEEPIVASARVTLAPGGVDRATTAKLQFPSGATGAITTSLLSRHLLALHLNVTGTRGRLRYRNPILPKLFGALTVTVDGVRRHEEVSKTSTYAAQLAAFRDAITLGAPFPSTAEDAVKNMAVIDAIYRAAGQPPREPTS